MKAIKSTYKLSLGVFLLINVVLYLIVIFGPYFFYNHLALARLFDNVTALFLGVLPVCVLVLGGLMSPTAKARWVYWRYRNPLPGSEAFSRYIHSDPRVSPKVLRNEWGRLPGEPTKQNRLWYRMYKTVEDHIAIQEAHRDWLFSRDLTSYSIIFLIVFGVAILGSEVTWKAMGFYWGYLLFQYLLLMYAARTHGRRFVCNVLADLSVPKGE